MSNFSQQISMVGRCLALSVRGPRSVTTLRLAMAPALLGTRNLGLQTPRPLPRCPLSSAQLPFIFSFDQTNPAATPKRQGADWN